MFPNNSHIIESFLSHPRGCTITVGQNLEKPEVRDSTAGFRVLCYSGRAQHREFGIVWDTRD